MRRSTIAVLGLSLVLATPVAAEPVGADTYSISVPVSGADLASEASVHALYTRVQEAANAVCAESLRDTAPRIQTIRACRSEALSQAIEDAGLPALTRHYAALRSGQTPEQATTIAAR